MARIDSKTDWVGSDRPLPQDFNRIESNNEQSFSEIDVESNARIAGDNILDGEITILKNNITSISTGTVILTHDDAIITESSQSFRRAYSIIIPFSGVLNFYFEHSRNNSGSSIVQLRRGLVTVIGEWETTLESPTRAIVNVDVPVSLGDELILFHRSTTTLGSASLLKRRVRFDGVYDTPKWIWRSIYNSIIDHTL